MSAALSSIDWSTAVVSVCRPRCFTCGNLLTEDVEGFCSDVCERTVPIFRWACTCGRFVAEQDICQRVHRDPSAYYSIRDEAHHHCSRCGMRPDLPNLVAVGTTVLDSETPDLRGETT